MCQQWHNGPHSADTLTGCRRGAIMGPMAKKRALTLYISDEAFAALDARTAAASEAAGVHVQRGALAAALLHRALGVAPPYLMTDGSAEPRPQPDAPVPLCGETIARVHRALGVTDDALPALSEGAPPPAAPAPPPPAEEAAAVVASFASLRRQPAKGRRAIVAGWIQILRDRAGLGEKEARAALYLDRRRLDLRTGEVYPDGVPME